MPKAHPNKLDAEAREINRGFFCSWWVARTTGIVVITLLFVVLSLSSVILWLMPLKEIKPYLLTGYNKDTQVVKVEPIEKTTQGWHKLMEIYSKEFVINLHTLDGQTELARLKTCQLMAEDETQEFIENQLNTNNPHSAAKKMLEASITRSVEIKQVINLAPEAPNTWQVNWVSLEQEANTQVQRKNHFISVITAETQPKIFGPGDEELNPIGFTVIRYSLRMGTP